MPMLSPDPVLSRRLVLGGGTLAGIAASPLALLPRTAAARGAAQDASQGGAGAGPGGAEITVDQARTAPIPIAIPSFGPGIGDQMTQVISDDLAGCGLFRPIPGAPAAPPGAAPAFDAYKSMGAQALAQGTTSGGGGGGVRVEFRLWNVLTGQQLQGTAYTTGGGNWRRIAHIIADVIYERMLGDKGYFDTRICYVSVSGSNSRPTTRLAIMDQDGANNRTLTGGEWLVKTPRFHPTRDQIAFMSYANDRPRVYLFDLNSGRQQVLGEFPGISFAPRFSPSGSEVVMSATRGSGSDIFTVSLGGGGKRQLTNSGAIDTSPCYSPDGSQIVFNSDRGGSPQLYVMSAGGGGARRISFGSGTYGSPVWSPRGDLIAFVRIGGGFSLGVMNPDGTGERILAKNYTIDSPTFCPNGRVLAYNTGGGGALSSSIAQIDIAGFNQHAMRTAGPATAPAWSPLKG